MVLSKKIIHVLLFWGHLGVIVGGVLMGLVLPLWLVVTLVVLHRIHVVMLKSCAFSLLQRKAGGLEAELNFLQHASGELFKKRITRQQATHLDYALVAASVGVALVKTLLVR